MWTIHKTRIMNKLRKVFGSTLGLDLLKGHQESYDKNLFQYKNASSTITGNGTYQNTSLQDVSYINYDQQSVSTIHGVHSVNYTDPITIHDPLFTKIHKWAFLGDVNKVKKFMKKNDVNGQDREARAPLHLAASSGHIEVILVLVGARADPELLDRDGRTPFLVAVEMNQIEAVQVLLQYKINRHAIDHNGNSALHLCCRSGNKDLIELLVDSGIKIDCENIDGQTPLHIATENLNIDAVHLLLEKKCMVNVADKEGVSPLMISAKLGSDQLVSLLLKEGADPLTTDRSGWNAVSYAKYSMHEELEEKLVKTIKLKDQENKSSSSNIISPESLISKDDSWKEDSSLHSITKQKLTYFTADDDSCHTLPSKNLKVTSKISVGPPKPPRQFTSTPNLMAPNSVQSSKQHEKPVQDYNALERYKGIRRSKSLVKDATECKIYLKKQSESLRITDSDNKSNDCTLDSNITFSDEEVDLSLDNCDSHTDDKIPGTLMDKKLMNTCKDIDSVSEEMASPVEDNSGQKSLVKDCEEIWESNPQIDSVQDSVSKSHQNASNPSGDVEYGYTKMYFGDSNENVYIDIENIKDNVNKLDQSYENASWQPVSSNADINIDDISVTQDKDQLLSSVRKLRLQLNKERGHRLANEQLAKQALGTEEVLLNELNAMDRKFEQVCQEKSVASMILELLRHRTGTLDDKASYVLKSLTNTSLMLGSLETEKQKLVVENTINNLEKTESMNLCKRGISDNTQLLRMVSAECQTDNVEMDCLPGKLYGETPRYSSISSAKDSGIDESIQVHLDDLPVLSDCIFPKPITDTLSVGCQTECESIKEPKELISDEFIKTFKNLINPIIIEQFNAIDLKTADIRDMITELFVKLNNFEKQCNVESFIDIFKKLQVMYDTLCEKSDEQSRKIHNAISLSENAEEMYGDIKSELCHIKNVMDRQSASAKPVNDIEAPILELSKNLNDRMDSLETQLESILKFKSQITCIEEEIKSYQNVFVEKLSALESMILCHQTETKDCLIEKFHKTLDTMNETIDGNFQIVLDTLQEVEQNIIKNVTVLNDHQRGSVQESFSLLQSYHDRLDNIHMVVKDLNIPKSDITSTVSKSLVDINTLIQSNGNDIKNLKSTVESSTTDVKNDLKKCDFQKDISYFKEQIHQLQEEFKLLKKIVKNGDTTPTKDTLKCSQMRSNEDHTSTSLDDKNIEISSNCSMDKYLVLQEENRKLETELLRKSQVCKKLEFRLYELEVDVGELEEELTLKNNDNIRLRKLESELQRELIGYRQQLTKVSEIKTRNIVLEEKVHELESDIHNKEVIISCLQQSLELMRTQKVDVMGEVDILKRDLLVASSKYGLSETDGMFKKSTESQIPENNIQIEKSQFDSLYNDLKLQFESVFNQKINELNEAIDEKFNAMEIPFEKKPEDTNFELIASKMTELKNQITELHGKIDMSNNDKDMWITRYNDVVDRYNKLQAEAELTEGAANSLTESEGDFAEILKDIKNQLKQPYPESEFLAQQNSLTDYSMQQTDYV